MASRFPKNFVRLHRDENSKRQQSIEAIENSEDLVCHVRVLHASMDLIAIYSGQHSPQNDDELTIQLIGCRLFNGGAVALSTLLSGYYQPSALQQRDLLETVFLLDYFTIESSLIEKWRMSNEKARRQAFSPATVRKHLDTRDGYSERKREAAYKRLCELAGHATPGGFRMLRPETGAPAHIGPFFSLEMLNATLEELTKTIVQAAIHFPHFFTERSKSELEVSIMFMEAQGSWSEKFYGRHFDRRGIEKLKALLTRLRLS